MTFEYPQQVVSALFHLGSTGLEFRMVFNQSPSLPIRSLVYGPWRKDIDKSQLAGLSCRPDAAER
jgi:hypothetical protein